MISGHVALSLAAALLTLLLLLVAWGFGVSTAHLSAPISCCALLLAVALLAFNFALQVNVLNVLKSVLLLLVL